MRGQAPLTPVSIIHLQSPINGMLHGARVDETPSARGPIAIESRRGVRISHEKRIPGRINYGG